MRLVSENPEMPPLIVREEDLMIQGVLVGVIRRLLPQARAQNLLMP